MNKPDSIAECVIYLNNDSLWLWRRWLRLQYYSNQPDEELAGICIHDLLQLEPDCQLFDSTEEPIPRVA